MSVEKIIYYGEETTFDQTPDLRGDYRYVINKKWTAPYKRMALKIAKEAVIQGFCEIPVVDVWENRHYRRDLRVNAEIKCNGVTVATADYYGNVTIHNEELYKENPYEIFYNWDEFKIPSSGIWVTGKYLRIDLESAQYEDVYYTDDDKVIFDPRIIYKAKKISRFFGGYVGFDGYSLDYGRDFLLQPWGYFDDDPTIQKRLQKEIKSVLDFEKTCPISFRDYVETYRPEDAKFMSYEDLVYEHGDIYIDYMESNSKYLKTWGKAFAINMEIKSNLQKLKGLKVKDPRRKNTNNSIQTHKEELLKLIKELETICNEIDCIDFSIYDFGIYNYEKTSK